MVSRIYQTRVGTVRITLAELRALVVSEASPTPSSWAQPRSGGGTPDAMAGFAGKTNAGTKTTVAKTVSGQGNPPPAPPGDGPRTQAELVKAIRELITQTKGVAGDPRALQTLFGILQGAIENIKTLKTKSGTGLGQGVARSISANPKANFNDRTV